MGDGLRAKRLGLLVLVRGCWCRLREMSAEEESMMEGVAAGSGDRGQLGQALRSGRKGSPQVWWMGQEDGWRRSVPDKDDWEWCRDQGQGR